MAALKVVEAFFLSLVCIGAFSGNALLFFLVAKTPALQTKGNIFILNLAAADLLVSVLNMPITLVSVITEDWILGDVVCQVSGFFTLLTFVASCMALTMISVNRYCAIVHWTTYHRIFARWKCAMYVALTWAITIGLSIPPFFGWASFKFDKGQSYCFAEWTESKSYTIFMIAACLLGPLCVMSFCYNKIIRFQIESNRSVDAIGQSTEGSLNTLSDMHSDDPEASRTTAVRSNHRLIRTILSLIVVFAVCWSPFAIIMIVQVFTGATVPRSIDFGSLVLGCMNSFLNVFVYNATNKNIRAGYKKLLCWYCKPN